MFLLTGLAALDNKILAYDFLKNSGINDTAAGTGHLTQKTFSGGLTSGIGLIIQAGLSLLGVVFLGLAIYAGLMWMTAEGNDERIAKAKKILTQSTIGLVIVFAAYAISYFILNALSQQTLK